MSHDTHIGVKPMAQPPRIPEDASATPDSAPREARLEIRLTQEQKTLIVRAAAARGGSLAEFVPQAVQDAAMKAVTEYEVLRLCTVDQEAFVTALLTPREPSETLKAAYKEYRERVGA
jgi:uncharacterized protein (DUF1778 family)